MSKTVADLDEAELLDLITSIVSEYGPENLDDVILGPGDDSAILRAHQGQYTMSTDVLVEDQHFRTSWSSGFDIGWRAAMQNLADAAAMGARPTAIVVALVLPPTTQVAWVTDFATGLARACGQHQVSVVGGDLASGDKIVASVTVVGDLAGRRAVLRSGAKPGDMVAVSGNVGWSAAGLAVLETVPDRSDERSDIAHQSNDAVQLVLDGFKRPSPAISAGIAAGASASAMMDISDGLICDAYRIACASGVVIDIAEPGIVLLEDAELLSEVALALGYDELTAQTHVRQWLLAGGEDHAMLATFPPGNVHHDFRIIGTVGPLDSGQPRVLVNGAHYSGPAGWDHFRR